MVILDSLDLTLIGACLIGGIASTSVGTSGGFTFAAMASIFPVTVVVPIHASVEVAASIIRSALLRQEIGWSFVFSFLSGGAVGILIAVPFLGMIPEDKLQLILGLFIVLVTWVPISQALAQARELSRIGGLLTSFLTIFVGATGPLVAVLISKQFQRHTQVIATHAACMAAQHGAKIVVFVLGGWSAAAFVIEIALMIVATTVGTWIGRFIIFKGPEKLIRLFFKLAVSLLGIRLIIVSIFDHL